MRRQKGFKKIKLPNFLQDLREQIFRKLASVFVIFLFIIISLLLLKAFLYRSDYFKVRTVETKDISTGQGLNLPINNELLLLYSGKNLFAINLNLIAKPLEASYPDAKDIAVKRMLPDKIVIEFNFRKPIALIGDTRFYPVDEESFILSNIDAMKLKTLPVITGIDIKNEERKGKKVDSVNLKMAIELLKEMKKSKFSVEYNVISVDAGDINNLSFYLKNGLEIKIGCEDFKGRLSKLKKQLKDPRLIVERVKYIDLRFEGIVIGPK